MKRTGSGSKHLSTSQQRPVWMRLFALSSVAVLEPLSKVIIQYESPSKYCSGSIVFHLVRSVGQICSIVALSMSGEHGVARIIVGRSAAARLL